MLSSLALDEQDFACLDESIAIMLIAITVITGLALELGLLKCSQFPAIFELNLP